MANTTLAQIRAGIITVLKTLKTANGYSTQLEDAQIYESYGKDFANCKDYPKATLWFESFEINPRPSDVHDKVAMFSVMLIDRKESGDAADYKPYESVEAFIDDLEKALSQDHNLGGIVENVMITDAEMDSGFAHPEGIGIAAVKVEYKSRFH